MIYSKRRKNTKLRAFIGKVRLRMGYWYSRSTKLIFPRYPSFCPCNIKKISIAPSPPSSRTLTSLLSRCVLPARATGLLARVRGPAPLRRQLRGEASVHRRREGSRMSAPGARARRSKLGVRRWAIGGCTRVRLRVRCVLQPVSRARVEV